MAQSAAVLFGELLLLHVANSQMGTKDSWTDWHVDFAASSVYYNVHTGSKVSLRTLLQTDPQVFFFIRPTEANLAAYAQCELINHEPN